MFYGHAMHIVSEIDEKPVEILSRGCKRSVKWWDLAENLTCTMQWTESKLLNTQIIRGSIMK